MMGSWANRLPYWLSVAPGLLLLAGCGGQSEVRCNPFASYLESRSAAELRIPDDLSVPNDIESLKIPEVSPDAEAVADEQGTCLDASPALIGNN